MKNVLMITTILGVLALPSMAIAQDDPGQAAAPDSAATEEAGSAAVTVGNKICPVSGEKIGEMGEAIHVEHEGKIYNLCCPMCVKDFQADPQKYIEKVNAEMEGAGEAVHEDAGGEHSGHGH